MNNNILKELEQNIIKNGDASYTSIDMCIKQNNIFGILFISEFIPNINNIIEIFRNLLKILKSEENDIFTLIICICSEEKEDYEKTLLKISDLSCFILPFDSKQKEKLINNYNIIILPCFLFFSKDGKNLQSLNNEEIEKINSNQIKGWKDILGLIGNNNNIKKNIEKYYIGMEGYIFGHRHILFYSDYLSKNPKYGKLNWYCDLCGETHPYTDNNFYCDLCGYDVCDACYENNKKY